MRAYDREDLDLIIASPARFTFEQWKDIGICIGWFQQQTAGTGRNVTMRIHLLMRQAIQAFNREGTRSPWDDEFNRKPPMVLVAKPVNASQSIIAYLADHGRSRRIDITAAMVQRGYAEGTVPPTLHVLMRKRLVVRKDAGVYDLAPGAGDRLASSLLVEVEQ